MLLELAGRESRMPFNAPARCPHCGNQSGLCLAPREARTNLTPVRCFACRVDAPTHEWFKDGATPFTDIETRQAL
jgi:DNA-directed RNA polymerase subunit N (RpoN/RPB10)